MSLSLTERVAGKWRSAKALLEFRAYLTNWRDVWGAYRSGRPLPPFVLKGGPTLHHGETDDPVLLFREIIVGGLYTGPQFYRPGPSDRVVDLGGNIGFFAPAVE